MGPFIWKNVVQCRRDTCLPELPWASQLFIRFLSKRGEPFCDGRVTLQAEPKFLCIITLARPGSTRSKYVRQSERTRALLAPAKEIISLKNVPKVDLAGRVILLRGTGFLHINRALSHITVNCKKK